MLVQRTAGTSMYVSLFFFCATCTTLSFLALLNKPLISPVLSLSLHLLAIHRFPRRLIYSPSPPSSTLIPVSSPNYALALGASRIILTELRIYVQTGYRYRGRPICAYRDG